MAHEFLSEDWFTAVDALRSEAPEPPAGAADLVINVVVTEAPAGDVEMHLAGGQLGRGHADGAPTTITAPYDVAKALLVQGDQAVAMQAFMAGKIKVAGDMTKIMAMQGAGTSPEQQAFAQKISALTA
jgi:putative sterol carrier protein